MPTETIPGVELVKAGTWRGRTGPVTITKADLADAVKAGSDAEVDAGAIKLGHVSNLNEGQPAYGWVRNLRLSGDGGTLIGDLTDVPVKLAQIMAKAFRRRSAELAFGVRTPGGKRYAMALTGLALLGATAPAVKGLADIADLYDLSGHDDPEADSLTAVDLAAGVDDATRLGALADAIADVERLGVQGAQRDRIVAELEAAAGVTDATIPAPAGGTRNNDPARTDPPEETETMDDAKLRKMLGLADDADLEAALTDLKGKADKADPPAGETPEQKAAREAAEAEAAKGGDGKGGSEAEPAKGEPVAAGAASLSAEVLSALKGAGLAVVDTASLSELTTAAEDLKTARLQGAVDEAVKAGKILPAEAAAFFAEGKDGKPATGILITDEAGGLALLSSMTARFPTAETGHGSPVDLSDEDAVSKATDEFLVGLGLADAAAE